MSDPDSRALIISGIIVFVVLGIIWPTVYTLSRRWKKRQAFDWKFDQPVGTEIWRSTSATHRIIKTHAGCWQIQYRSSVSEEWRNGNMLHEHEDVELFINSKSI